MRRTLLVASLALLVLTAGAAAARDGAVNRPLLGVRGDAARFQAQTGQESVVRHAFLGWEQGRSWGSPFADLFRLLAPVPMVHLGTSSQASVRREAISPRAIAAGRGDAYLFALNRAIAAWGRPVYVRPLAEMNNPATLYSPGPRKGASHSPAAYRAAFCRIYRIVHGTLGGRNVVPNPVSRVVVIWNPVAGMDRGGGPPAQEFYPGDACVDMVGNDIYPSSVGVASWAANDRLYAAHPSKPYAFPEWGLDGIDDPGFVRRLCDFVKTHGRVRLAAYYESKPGSQYDLGDKPKARDAYRRCLTPLGAPAPSIGALPGAAVIRPLPAGQLRLTADPATGAAPLAVTFALESGIDKVVRWQLAFGDGQLAQGAGEPPASAGHTYAADGVYTATLIVYQGPPYTGTAIRFLTSAKVEVGDEPGTLLALRPSPASGKAPLAVSFRTIVNLPRPVVSWQLLYGDGQKREGTGKPPGFLGYTYRTRGAYRAVLIVYLAPPFTGTAVRFLAFGDVRVG